jgi:hypothetical protein
MSKELDYLTLSNMAVALNATTPTPADGQGSLIWSTTTNSTLSWDGTKWAGVSVPSATTSVPGIVQLEDTGVSSSTTQAATAHSVSVANSNALALAIALG